MRRFVLTAEGSCREQYIVEAESAEAAEEAFGRGEYTFPVVSEVYDAEVVETTDIGPVTDLTPPMRPRDKAAWRRVNARRA